MPECIDCLHDLSIADPLQGEIVDCPDCGAELEVVQRDPVELDRAPEVQEDWGE